MHGCAEHKGPSRSLINRIDDATTGASVGHTPPRVERTRTIQDVVDDIGFLRNQSELLVNDSQDLHESIGRMHSDGLEQELRSTALRLAQDRLPALLDRLSMLGFSCGTSPGSAESRCLPSADGDKASQRRRRTGSVSPALWRSARSPKSAISSMMSQDGSRRRCTRRHRRVGST